MINVACLLQAEADQQLDSAFQEFQQGKFKETPQNWLLNSWQGDALQVTAGASHSWTTLRVHVACLAAAPLACKSPTAGHELCVTAVELNVQNPRMASAGCCG